MKNLAIITIAVLLVQCEPVVPVSSTIKKQLIFDNHDYEAIVGNVRLLPFSNGQVNELDNPIINLNQQDQLFLTFDLLTDQFENLSAKIYHCNKDWTLSGLRDLEYLDEINNYRIINYDYSNNTVQPYINYQLQVEKPTITGNYILAVFRRANPDDVLLTRKFLVVETNVSIDQAVTVSSIVSKRNQNQQIAFSLNYSNLLVNAPTRDIRVTILQNHNWRTQHTDIQPTVIRATDGYLEYNHLDEQMNFAGWNEFRFTDLRTLNVSGRNVGRISSTPTLISAEIGLDKQRGTSTYSQGFRDINGNYLIQNNDTGEGVLNTDYVSARFLLKSEKIDGDVYVIGRFNNWQLNDQNRMRYDASNGIYTTDYYLKQGYYDYMYHVVSSTLPPHHFEGSHFQAENQYEILVYYRNPGTINDQIIGYKKFGSFEN